MSELPFSLHQALVSIAEWRRTAKLRFFKRRTLVEGAFFWIEQYNRQLGNGPPLNEPPVADAEERVAEERA